MSDEEQPAHQMPPPERTPRSWGTIAAGFSAACALALSAYTAYLQRQQVKAQVWPILVWGISASTVDESDEDGGPAADAADAADAASVASAASPAGDETTEPRKSRFTFTLRNQGVGPALVRAMEVTLDGKPIRRWDDLVGPLTPLLREPRQSWDGQVTLTHDRIIAAGEETKPFGPYGDDEARAMYQAFPRIAVRLCYCSVLEDCWEIRARGFEDKPEPERAASCFRPAVPFQQ